MRGLELMITRAKQRLVMGQSMEQVRSDLIGSGCDESLVYWATRAAKFEIEYDERCREDEQ